MTCTLSDDRCTSLGADGPRLAAQQLLLRGVRNLPFRDFDLNAVWLELVLIAHDLIAWTQTLALTGELATCEPKRLRYRLLHVAARLAFSGRQAKLRLAATWAWATDLAAAFAKLKALPAPAG